MCRTTAQRFAALLARPTHVARRDVSERHKLHAIDLNLDPAHAVPPADLRMRLSPQPERNRDLPGCDVVVELLAEFRSLRS